MYDSNFLKLDDNERDYLERYSPGGGALHDFLPRRDVKLERIRESRARNGVVNGKRREMTRGGAKRRQCELAGINVRHKCLEMPLPLWLPRLSTWTSIAFLHKSMCII